MQILNIKKYTKKVAFKGKICYNIMIGIILSSNLNFPKGELFCPSI